MSQRNAELPISDKVSGNSLPLPDGFWQTADGSDGSSSARRNAVEFVFALTNKAREDPNIDEILRHGSSLGKERRTAGVHDGC